MELNSLHARKLHLLVSIPTDKPFGLPMHQKCTPQIALRIALPIIYPWIRCVRTVYRYDRIYYPPLIYTLPGTIVCNTHSVYTGVNWVYNIIHPWRCIRSQQGSYTDINTTYQLIRIVRSYTIKYQYIVPVRSYYEFNVPVYNTIVKFSSASYESLRRSSCDGCARCMRNAHACSISICIHDRTCIITIVYTIYSSTIYIHMVPAIYIHMVPAICNIAMHSRYTSNVLSDWDRNIEVIIPLDWICDFH